MKRALPILLLAVATAAGRDPAAGAKPKTAGARAKATPSMIQRPAPVPGGGARSFESELAGRDVQFLQNATAAARDQAALAELVRQQKGSEQLQLVAESIVTTQATEARELARLTEARRIPASPAVAGALGELASLSGPKFEKAWVEQLIAVNERSVAAYESGVQSGDAELKSFAGKMLSLARARLQVANRLGGRAMPPRPAADPKEPAPIPPPVGAPSAVPSAAEKP